MLRSHRTALVLSAAALALSACGSSSSKHAASTGTAAVIPSPDASTSGTSQAPPPTSGFSAQVNTLCQQANAKLRAVGDLKMRRALFQQYLVKLEAITPPASQAEAYTKFVDDLRAELTAQSGARRQALNDIPAQATKLGAPACAGH